MPSTVTGSQREDDPRQRTATAVGPYDAHIEHSFADGLAVPMQQHHIDNQDREQRATAKQENEHHRGFITTAVALLHCRQGDGCDNTNDRDNSANDQTVDDFGDQAQQPISELKLVAVKIIDARGRCRIRIDGRQGWWLMHRNVPTG